MCQLENDGIRALYREYPVFFSSVNTFISALTFSSKISFIWFHFNESDFLLHKVSLAILDLGVPNLYLTAY